MTNTAQSAAADQLAADLRTRRCCDALDPCDSCRVGRLVVAVSRRLAEVPAPAASVPSQRRPSRLGMFARKAGVR